MPILGTSRRRDLAVCSFCGRRSDEVQAMVAGSGVRICDGCVALAAEIIAEQVAETVHPRFRRERSLRDQASGWLTPQGTEDGDSLDVQFESEAQPDLEVLEDEEPGPRRT